MNHFFNLIFIKLFLNIEINIFNKYFKIINKYLLNFIKKYLFI